jgi:hypothetical protein
MAPSGTHLDPLADRFLDLVDAAQAVTAPAHPVEPVRRRARDFVEERREIIRVQADLLRVLTRCQIREAADDREPRLERLLLDERIADLAFRLHECTFPRLGLDSGLKRGILRFIGFRFRRFECCKSWSRQSLARPPGLV